MTFYLDPQVIASPELRGFVAASYQTGNQGNLEDVREFFEKFIDLFEADDTGQPIAETLVSDWGIFTDRAAAEKHLPALMTSAQRAMFKQSKAALRPSVCAGVKDWAQFKNEVKWENRFFSEFPDEEMNLWLQPNDCLRRGTRLFRSRIQRHPDKVFARTEMGCPPGTLATGGRANPHGIPYLYLSEAARTTLYEVRAVYLDRVSVGTFEVLEDLPVVDFTKKPDLFCEFNSVDDKVSLAEIVKKTLTFRAIAADLSHPMRSTDNAAVEYTPTQVVCEFCKLHGAGGIRFRSSLDRDGVNVVLFDPSKARCTGVTPVEVTQVSLSFEKR